MPAATLIKPSKTTLGSQIDEMWELREKKRAAEAEVKSIEKAIEEIEQSVFEKLDSDEITSGKGKKASVSITPSTIANVLDWDAFHAYIAKNKYFHLLQKRASDVAVRELWDAGKKVPGVQPLSKRRLNVRSLTSA